MRNLDPRRARFMRMRIALLSLLLFAGAFTVLRRGYDLQVTRAPELRQMAEEQYLRDVQLAPKRGTIVDRNGAELAVSVNVDSVYANPRKLHKAGLDPIAIAGRLSSLLGVDAEVIARRLASKRYFVWIKRRVSPTESKAVASLRLQGIELTSESRRFYPNRSLASQLIGVANVDGKGVAGLELMLDDRLRGSSEPVPAIRDSSGAVVFSEQLFDDRAARGDDVTLTIDRTLQRIAERELELTVKTFEARHGSVVVLDPQSGEILAMASYPSFNPNDPGSAPVAHRRSRAVTDVFEPGSTIKPFTVAGALAGGAVRPDEEIDCEDGMMYIADDKIHDTHHWERLTPGKILAYSSNIGTAKIGMAMGKRRLYRTLRNFGFGRVPRLGLPGEVSGILRHYKKWYDLDAATISFGQGMSATTIQLAAAMGALANNGKLMEPILVKRVTDARGQVVEEALPRVRRQVVPKWAARLVSDMLVAVTGEGGTGEEAAIDGYLVAGKTGTAQKADYRRGGYAEGKWTANFVGFAPARNPAVVTAVVIDEPLIAHAGGKVAGPAFRRITEASLRHLGVVADAPRAAEVAKRPKREKAQDGALVAEAEAEDDAQEPTVPVVVELSEGEVLVPDLAGQTARAAFAAARAAGVELRLQGSGVVVSQQPAANTAIAQGQPVSVLLAAPDHVRGEPVGPANADVGAPAAAVEVKLAAAVAGGDGD
ncbi:MAG: penicillin-binding transpeptidase domain-containing protein [Myxococcales bacterium]|nr:penicillin-binding transpeptidase domain-containing protein [Myxococcales bacterium]